MGWLRVLKSAFAAAMRDDLLDWAATLSFYFLFSLFPAILLIAALLAEFRMQRLVGNLVVALTAALPRTAAQLVAQQLQGLLRHHVPGLISFDLVVLFYSASQGFTGFMAALNAAYEAPETRSYWHRLAIAFGLTFSVGIFIALALVAVVLGSKLLIILAGPVHAGFALTLAFPLLRWAVTFGLQIAAVAILYRFAPNLADRRSRGRVIAVTFAMTIWVIVSALLAAYVNNFSNYSAVYGSLGAVIALMLWFYLLALAVLLGAEIHHAWLREHGLALGRADTLNHARNSETLHRRPRGGGPARPAA
jgi:membrane protein